MSLQVAVDRALKLYPALRSYFLSKGMIIAIKLYVYVMIQYVDEKSARFIRLQHAFDDKMTEVYLLFYSNVLCLFTQLNCFLQSEQPIIGVLYKQVHALFTCLQCTKTDYYSFKDFWYFSCPNTFLSVL